MPEEWVTKKRPGEFFEISDIVHGHIAIFQPIGKIIDTKAFQRLRNLTQLNASQFVYPSANHNRFTHSLGVYHLSRKMAKHLKKKCPTFGINSTDVLCVSIAGLIHDIGHGPFSHFYEHFLKHMGVEGFAHEEMSCKIFDHFLKTDEQLRISLEKYLTPVDILFIKELVNPPKQLLNERDEWKPKGRGREKAFLYEIVNNPHNGLDVDKIDYILRDAKITNVGNRLRDNEWRRILNNAIVDQHPEENRNCIAYSHKTINLISNVFEDRIKLHETVYQHKASLAVDKVMLEAMERANQHLLFTGSGRGDRTTLQQENDENNGGDGHAIQYEYKMTEAFHDPEAFLEMDNSLVDIIKYLAKRDHGNVNAQSDLRQSCELLKKIENRELPKRVMKWELQGDEDKTSLTEQIKNAMLEGGNGQLANEFWLNLVKLDQGQGIERSPMQKIVLYAADKNGKCRTRFFESTAESGGKLFAFIYVPFDKRAKMMDPVKNAVKALLKANGTGKSPSKGGQKRHSLPLNDTNRDEDDDLNSKSRKRTKVEEQNVVMATFSEGSNDSNEWEKIEEVDLNVNKKAMNHL